jgi:hypothetical protein
MRIPFKEDFGTLPDNIANALIDELETLIMQIRDAHGLAMRDGENRPLSSERVSAKISAIFDVADALRPK